MEQRKHAPAHANETGTDAIKFNVVLHLKSNQPSLFQLSPCEEGLRRPPSPAHHCSTAESRPCPGRRCHTGLGLSCRGGPHSPFTIVLANVSIISWVPEVLSGPVHVVRTEGGDGRPTGCRRSAVQACLGANICTTDCTFYPTVNSRSLKQHLAPEDTETSDLPTHPLFVESVPS